MNTRIARMVLLVAGLPAGFALAFYGLSSLEDVVGIGLTVSQKTSILVAFTALGGVVGFLIAPRLVLGALSLINWTEGRLRKTPLMDIMAGALGLIIGLVIANLFSSALGEIPYVGGFLPMLSTLLFGYLGMMVAVNKREELSNLFSWVPLIRSRHGGQDNLSPKILDTSVIIDGRIADICETGFIEGTLIIPNFVLEELQHIADSSDNLKRNRGRRGLDILNRIQRDLGIKVEIYDASSIGNGTDVDTKLVLLAKALRGKIVTNDFNLNKVAELQGITVLNVNELANAVKPVVLPGEEMEVYLIKDGKESGQGIGYLDDGTMIVVDGGKRHIGETIDVSVTSVLQTAAGRMIFAKPKNTGRMSS